MPTRPGPCPPRSGARRSSATSDRGQRAHEDARDFARSSRQTKAYKVSRDKRKKVEMLFTNLKRIIGLDRLRLRGPNGAKDEFLVAAIAQNLRKLAKLRPLPVIEEAAA